MPFLKLSNLSIEGRISYKELIYFNTYLDAFYQTIKDNNNTIDEAQIKEIIYLINYNSIELQNLKTTIIKSSIDKIPDIAERIDYLYHTLKLISQRNCRLNISYDSNLPSLKEQIIKWVEEEITYLNKSIELKNNQEPINLFTDTEKTKIHSGFTVAQLAYFISYKQMQEL